MKLLNFFGVYSISDWVLSNKKGDNLKLYKGIKVKSEIKSKLLFITNNQLSRGFYLFGILHFGKNNRTFGNISSKLNFFKQSRPLYPSKRRWRIVRVRNKSQLILELKNIEEEIQIREIWLIKIPYLEAKRRIIFRLINRFNLYRILSLNKANIWRTYNKLLKSQAKGSNNFDYEEWIDFKEKINNKILRKYDLKEKYKLFIRNNSDYSKVYAQNAWIFFRAEKEEVRENALKIAQMILIKKLSMLFISKIVKARVLILKKIIF